MWQTGKYNFQISYCRGQRWLVFQPLPPQTHMLPTGWSQPTADTVRVLERVHSRETRNWLNGWRGLQVFLLAWLHLPWNSASTWNSFYSSLLSFSLPPQVSDLCQSLKALSSPAPSCNNYFINIIPSRLLLLSESKKDTTALSRSYPAESCFGRNRREKDKG